jgi:hypothetical protein
MAWSLKRNADGSLARDAITGTLCACVGGNCLWIDGADAGIDPFTEQLIAEDTVYGGSTSYGTITIQAVSASGYIEIILTIMGYPQSYRLSYASDSSGFVDPSGVYDWYSGENVPRPSTLTVSWGACP